MSNRPTTVSILGKEFKIQYPKKIDDGHTHGVTMGDSRLIKIASSSDDELFEDTLLHETIHAILYTSGVSEMLDERLEEAIVIAIENGLSQLYSRHYE
jgi:hypothetical protein